MATGIRDKVAILGMGCSKFGERWDKEADDLMVEAFEEAIADAGIEKNQIEAAWLATAIEEQHVGKSGVPLAVALRLPYIPVTRVENYCASGTEAFRGAVYAVASGAADIALALGVEKLKDTGYGGLPQRGRGALNSMYWPNMSAPGSFAQLAAAYRAKHNKKPEDLKRAMAHISVKSHDNGNKNPKAHLTNKITIETVLEAPTVAEPLGLYDCCGVSDGSACAIVTTPEIARSLGKKDLISVKALQLSVSNGTEASHNSWDGSYFATTRVASKRAYKEAGIDTPARGDRPDRGARLLLGDRARHDGGPLRVARGRRHQGRARRLLRRRRPGALPDRRRPEVLRPPDRRLRHAHDLRDLPADAGQGRPAAAPEDAALRPHPQPRRLPAPERVLDLGDRAARGVGIPGLAGIGNAVAPTLPMIPDTGLRRCSQAPR